MEWIFWPVVLALLIACTFAVIKLYESGGFVLTDLALLFGPFVVWVALLYSGIKDKSLSNLSEAVFLFLVVVGIFVARAFAFQRHTNQWRSLVGTAICLAAAIALYVGTPVLPE